MGERRGSRRRTRLLRVAVVAALGSGAAVAWRQDPDTVRAALVDLDLWLGNLDPRVAGLALLGIALALVVVRRHRRSRRRASDSFPSEAAKTRRDVTTTASAPVEAARGPAYTVHFNHEVRTPITAILGYVEMLSAEDASSAERVDFLERVRHNCRLLARLAEETLAFARTDSGDLTPFPESIELAELLNEPLLLTRPDAAAQQLSIAVAAEGHLPGSIDTDALYARQVIVRLLQTAIHLSEHGQIRVVVRATEPAGDRPAQIEIDVHDTNATLAEEVRTALFDPWHDETLHYVDVLSGTGLRLAIAKRLAEKLGGTVSAGSTGPAGGSYRFTLPVGTDSDVPWIDGPTIFDRTTTAPRTSQQSSALRGRVLVVEAASEIGWMLRTVVGGRGVEVETCSTSADAWDRLSGPADATEPWSALVVDLDDPDVDGPLLLQRLLLDRVTVPIVAVGDPECVPPACAGDVTVLAKPTRVLKLYDAVRPFLQTAA